MWQVLEQGDLDGDGKLSFGSFRRLMIVQMNAEQRVAKLKETSSPPTQAALPSSNEQQRLALPAPPTNTDAAAGEAARPAGQAAPQAVCRAAAFQERPALAPATTLKAL